MAPNRYRVNNKESDSAPTGVIQTGRSMRRENARTPQPAAARPQLRMQRRSPRSCGFGRHGNRPTELGRTQRYCQPRYRVPTRSSKAAGTMQEPPANGNRSGLPFGNKPVPNQRNPNQTTNGKPGTGQPQAPALRRFRCSGNPSPTLWGPLERKQMVCSSISETVRETEIDLPAVRRRFRFDLCALGHASAFGRRTDLRTAPRKGLANGRAAAFGNECPGR